MKVEPREVILKDGRKCIIRNATGADAEGMLNYLKVSARDTEYILRTPEEADVDYTYESEVKILEDLLETSHSLMLVAEVDGVITGNCGLNSAGRKKKLCHRAGFGIAIMKQYWGCGIGKALMSYALEISDNILHYEIVDLDVVSENTRALGLYEKLGFVKYGEHPMGLKLGEGRYFTEISMYRINPNLKK